MTDTTAEEVRSLFQKLKDEHPGDFITVAEIRNAVIEECAEVAEQASWACSPESMAAKLRSLKSGAKDA